MEFGPRGCVCGFIIHFCTLLGQLSFCAGRFGPSNGNCIIIVRKLTLKILQFFLSLYNHLFESCDRSSYDTIRPGLELRELRGELYVELIECLLFGQPCHLLILGVRGKFCNVGIVFLSQT